MCVVCKWGEYISISCSSAKLLLLLFLGGGCIGLGGVVILALCQIVFYYFEPFVCKCLLCLFIDPVSLILLFDFLFLSSFSAVPVYIMLELKQHPQSHVCEMDMLGCVITALPFGLLVHRSAIFEQSQSETGQSPECPCSIYTQGS